MIQGQYEHKLHLSGAEVLSTEVHVNELFVIWPSQKIHSIGLKFGSFVLFWLICRISKKTRLHMAQFSDLLCCVFLVH